MKAAVYKRYGLPDVVQITDADKPVLAYNEVLLKVRAASVNPYDRPERHTVLPSHTGRATRTKAHTTRR
jgi:NADPH:quinone reductase-like Zn-dependent oxidoreductase